MKAIYGGTRVAFQGEPGAFSQIAAHKLLGEQVQTVACATFESMFASIAEGRAELILAPLENTLAGPVLRCYDLLYQSELRMVGEVVLRIAHCVIGVPGARLEGLRQIHSHPVALAQCERFFATHSGIARAVAEDTAGSVRMVMERGDVAQAAIAGESAAREYGAEVLAKSVEDDAKNYTRFGLLLPEAKAEKVEGADATALVLTVANRSGALFRSLEPFAANEVDLMSLVSRPLVGEPWHYRFFLEVAAAEDDERMRKALAELEPRAVELRILGSYRSGK
jgi:prephenate dehydratase